MKIKELKPAEYNPRKITDEQLARLKKSLYEFGDLSGIVFNRRTGNLIGGHQRIKCLPPDAVIEKKELETPTSNGTVAEGYIHIPSSLEKFSYREVDWPIEKEKAANIAANKHGGEFDDESLAKLVAELSELPDFDKDLIGFGKDELDELLNTIAADGLVDDDDVPEVNTSEPITKTGDLYLLGRHRLLCGDSTKIEEIERLMDGKKADVVLTDPPYGINIVKNIKEIVSSDLSHPLKLGRLSGDKRKPPKLRGVVGGKGVVKPRLYRPIINDDKPFDPSFLLDLAKTIIIFGANNFSSKLPDKAGWLVWDKGISSDTTFSSCELAWCNQGNHVKKYEHKWMGMVRAGNRGEELQDRVHPTQKPVGLINNIIMDYSNSNEIILDVFLGSGSTLIACEKANRICYGMEIDPHYCDVIITRWCKYTGVSRIIKNGQEINWSAD